MKNIELKKKKNDFAEKPKNVIENVQDNKFLQTLYWGEDNLLDARLAQM